MLKELPAEMPLISQSARATVPRRGLYGPNLILAIFVTALAIDLIGRAVRALLIRFLRRTVPAPHKLETAFRAGR